MQRKQNNKQEAEAGFWSVAPVAERKPWLLRKKNSPAKKVEDTKEEEKPKATPRPKVFVSKVKDFDWFGATESICMHCGKTGHKGMDCPDNKSPEPKAETRKYRKRGHIAKDSKVAKKSEKAASDNLSDSTIDQSEASKFTEEQKEEEKVYQFGHLGKDAKGRKLKNSKPGVPDRVYHNFAAGDVFVGDMDCDQKILDKLGITCIVNAQAWGAQKPKYKGMEHFRFPISDLVNLPWKFNVATLEGVKRCLNPLMDFIESRTQNGQNVLI